MAYPTSTWFPPANTRLSLGRIAASGSNFICGGAPVALAGWNWVNWPLFGLVKITAGKEGGLDPVMQGMVADHLGNVAATGANYLRLHQDDCFAGGNFFGDVTNTGTLALDPYCVQAFVWFVQQCEALNLRIMMTCHYNRQLTTQDVLTIGTENNGVPSEVTELMGYAYGGQPATCIWPWCCCESQVLEGIEASYRAQVAGIMFPDGVPFGKRTSCLGWELRNEQSLTAGSVRGFTSLPTPALQGLYKAAAAPLIEQNGWNVNTLTESQFINIDSLIMQGWAQRAIAQMRPLTTGLIGVGTYFGNQSWAMLPELLLGDFIAFHFYPGGSFLGGNGDLNGLNAQSLRTGLAAVAAGCSWGLPTILDEWNPEIAQVSVPADQMESEILSVVNVLRIQGIAGFCPFSYANNVIQGEGSPWFKPNVWDLKNNAAFMAVIREAFMLFTDFSPSSVAPTIVSPTGGFFGTAAGQPLGPPSDPALYAVPGSEPVLMKAA